MSRCLVLLVLFCCIVCSYVIQSDKRSFYKRKSFFHRFCVVFFLNSSALCAVIKSSFIDEEIKTYDRQGKLAKKLEIFPV